jgi:hypothetical protein
MTCRNPSSAGNAMAPHFWASRRFRESLNHFTPVVDVKRLSIFIGLGADGRSRLGLLHGNGLAPAIAMAARTRQASELGMTVGSMPIGSSRACATWFNKGGPHRSRHQ